MLPTFTKRSTGLCRSDRRQLLHRFATLAVFAAAALGLQSICIKQVKAELTGRPNIVFIMADDLGYGDLGCYGSEVIQTPRLDRMAAEGIQFRNMYAGCTVCAPSRSVLMTGQHMGHTHVRGNAGGEEMSKQSLRHEDLTVADVLIGGRLSHRVVRQVGPGR